MWRGGSERLGVSMRRPPNSGSSIGVVFKVSGSSHAARWSTQVVFCWAIGAKRKIKCN